MNIYKREYYLQKVRPFIDKQLILEFDTKTIYYSLNQHYSKSWVALHPDFNKMSYS